MFFPQDFGKKHFYSHCSGSLSKVRKRNKRHTNHKERSNTVFVHREPDHINGKG